MIDRTTQETGLSPPAARPLGTGERIYAVVWLCDLRDSTRLCESMPVEDFLSLLNDFFDCTAGAVRDHGGRILTYIGDAALAVFPIEGHDKSLQEACTLEEGACTAALAAARAARERLAALNARRLSRGEPALRFVLALHVGDVMYGNIGLQERHHATVIGSAVNEAARLTELCKDLDRWILISSAIPPCFPEQVASIGRHRLRGLKGEHEVFTLVGERAGSGPAGGPGGEHDTGDDQGTADG